MKINLTLKKAIAEFLGVLMFLTSITASVGHTSLPQAALATTLGLAILITAGVSGGHLNPAVSLFFYAKRQLSLSELGAYIVAQLAGALAGTYIGSAIWGASLQAAQAGDAPSASQFLGELFATGGLVFLIGYLVTNKLGNIIPVAVGLWVFAAASFTQTGAQANPAVTFGLMYHGQGAVASAWFILAQLAGAAIAMVFLIIFAAKVSKPAKKKAAKK